MYNKVLLLGNLGRDPELKFLPSGQAVCNFSIATTERFKSGDEWKERTERHNIVVFGKSAESCAQYLVKGSTVYVDGRLQTRSWEGDKGKQYRTEIVANEVKFLSKGGEGRSANDDIPY